MNTDSERRISRRGLLTTNLATGAMALVIGTCIGKFLCDDPIVQENHDVCRKALNEALTDAQVHRRSLEQCDLTRKDLEEKIRLLEAEIEDRDKTMEELMSKHEISQAAPDRNKLQRKIYAERDRKGEEHVKSIADALGEILFIRTEMRLYDSTEYEYNELENGDRQVQLIVKSKNESGDKYELCVNCTYNTKGIVKLEITHDDEPLNDNEKVRVRDSLSRWLVMHYMVHER